MTNGEEVVRSLQARLARAVRRDSQVVSQFDLTWLKLVSSRGGLHCADDGSGVVVERGRGVQS